MYQPIILPHFIRQLRRLSKRYPHLEEAIRACLNSFRPDQHPSLGNHLYKIRLRSNDIPRGKSKGFRMIVFVVEIDRFCVPVCIYFKGDQQDVSRAELNNHLESILLEFHSSSQSHLPTV